MKDNKLIPKEIIEKIISMLDNADVPTNERILYYSGTGEFKYISRVDAILEELDKDDR